MNKFDLKYKEIMNEVKGASAKRGLVSEGVVEDFIKKNLSRMKDWTVDSFTSFVSKLEKLPGVSNIAEKIEKFKLSLEYGHEDEERTTIMANGEVFGYFSGKDKLFLNIDDLNKAVAGILNEKPISESVISEGVWNVFKGVIKGTLITVFGLFVAVTWLIELCGKLLHGTAKAGLNMANGIKLKNESVEDDGRKVTLEYVEGGMKKTLVLTKGDYRKKLAGIIGVVLNKTN